MELKTIIVGAGISGIACASELSKNNFSDYVILEARERIGGRIDTLKIGEDYYASGPVYLHGIKPSPLGELASDDLNLELFPPAGKVFSDSKFMKCLVNGRDNTKEFLSGLGELEICINEFDEEMTNLGKIDSSSINFFHKIKDLPFNEALSKSGWNPDSTLKRLAEVLMFDISSGATINRLSSAAEAIFEDDEGDHIIIDPRGYQSCLDHIIKTSRIIPDQILLRHCVESIHQRSDNGKITLKCSNEREFVCNNLVLALPLNVIKENQINFNPPISQSKMMALDKLEMTNYIKIFVEFTEVFWHNCPILIIYNDANDSLAWPDEKHSCRELIFWQNFDHLYEKGSKVLAAHVSGYWAEEFTKWTEPDLKAHILNIFTKAYPSEQVNISSVKLVSWKDEKYSRGSFTYAKPGLDMNIVQNIIKPEMSDKVYFSGDYMDLWHIGTTHAAYNSGIDAARKILEINTC